MKIPLLLLLLGDHVILTFLPPSFTILFIYLSAVYLTMLSVETVKDPIVGYSLMTKLFPCNQATYYHFIKTLKY
jgi:hypothetical protein